MDEIEKIFREKAIIHGNIFLYRATDALSVITACHEMGKKILGIDAFLLHENNKIQPVMSQSIDYSSGGYHSEDTDGGYWEAASNFVTSKISASYLFEIVYE